MGHVTLSQIGIITGISQEARLLEPLIARLSAEQRPLLRCADMQLDRAGQLAQQLVEKGVRALISFGVAGGLDTDLVPGDLILPCDVVNTNGVKIVCDPQWHKTARQHFHPQSTGRLVSSPVPVMTVDAKRALAHASGAASVDMESYTIGRVAQLANLPFLVLRVIVDPADQAIPNSAMAGTPFAVMKKAAKHPGEIPALLRLGRHMAVAKKTLSRVGRDGLPFFGL